MNRDDVIFNVLACLSFCAMIVVLGILLTWPADTHDPLPVKACYEQPKIEKIYPSTWWEL